MPRPRAERRRRSGALLAAAGAASLAVALPAGAVETAASVPRAAATGGPAMASFIGGLRFAELARSALAVVRARVVRQVARRDHRGLIVTDTRLKVEEVVAGDDGPPAGGEFTLTTLGGALGGEELAVSHMPRLEPGAAYVLFVDPRRRTYDPVVGNEAGVFRIGPGGEVSTYGGAEVLGVEAGGLRLGRGQGGPRDAGPPQGSGGVTVDGEARPASGAESPPMDSASFAAAIRSLR
jgi:hypothetical protein